MSTFIKYYFLNSVHHRETTDKERSVDMVIVSIDTITQKHEVVAIHDCSQHGVSDGYAFIEGMEVVLPYVVEEIEHHFNYVTPMECSTEDFPDRIVDWLDANHRYE